MLPVEGRRSYTNNHGPSSPPNVDVVRASDWEVASRCYLLDWDGEELGVDGEL